MSRIEARRRLQEADPNLKIMAGRKHPHAKRMSWTRIPKILSREEAEWLGLEEMAPIIPPQYILDIEGKWSKKDLQDLAWAQWIDPRGMDKEVLVKILIWAKVLDEYGNLTGKPPRR